MTTDIGAIFRSSSPAPPVEPSLVVHALRHAAADPDRVAIVDAAGGERLSRGDMAERSAAVAAGLAARGIGRGDLVAIALANDPWWPVVALGTWRAGAALVPLSPRWTAEEIGRLLARVRPRAAVASAPCAAAVRDGLAAAGVAADVAVCGGGEPPDPRPAPRGDRRGWEPRLGPGALAAVSFSSGTGGPPKGVRLTHGNVAAAAAQGAETLTLDAHSAMLAGAPFFHAIGLVLALCTPLLAGARVVTLPVPDRRRSLDAIAAHRVTHAAIDPTVLADIAGEPGRAGQGAESLEVVATGGEPVPAAVQRQASERLGCRARQGYGLTETTAVISGPMGRLTDPEGVGWLCAGTEARLVDPATGRDAACAQAGELWVRGPQVTTEGYHDDPAATAAAITPDGWLRTGDLVAIRDDGQLVVRGRVEEPCAAPAEIRQARARAPPPPPPAPAPRRRTGGR